MGGFEGPEETPEEGLLREYRERAEGLGIKPVDTSGFLGVDGLPIVKTEYYGKEIVVFKGVEPINDDIANEAAAERIGKIGTFDTNNGILTFINEQGRKFVAPYTPERAQMLLDAGYTEGGIPVPFSNEDRPATRAELMQAQESDPVVGNRSQRQADFLRDYSDEASERWTAFLREMEERENPKNVRTPKPF